MGSTLAPTELFTTITTAQVDADSPIDITLMGSLRANIINLSEQIIGDGATYTAAQGHDHDGLNSRLVAPKSYTAGTHVIFRSSVESTGNETTSYSDQLTVGLPFAGSLRIRYDLQGKTTVTGQFANANIFRNGSAVGTESTVILSASTGLVTFTEDVTGWLANDVMQIRTKVSPSTGSTAVARNLALSVTTASISEIALTVPALTT